MEIHAHIRALNERRVRTFNEAQNFLDRIESRGADMSAEEQAQWSRYNQEIDDLDAEVRRFVDRETREEESARIRETHAALFGGQSLARHQDNARAQLERVIRGEIVNGRPAHIDVPIGLAAREADLVRQGADAREIRNLLWDTGSVGSAVPTEMARQLYQYLEASNAVYRGPSRKFTTEQGGPFDLPTLASHSIGTQVIAQGTVIAGTDPTFDKTRFEAFKYGQLVHLSNETIQDTAFDILGWLAQDMGRGLGRQVATALVTGNGSTQPQGIMTALGASGAGSVVTGGTLIPASYETLVDLQYAVADEYRQSGSVAWLMKDSTAGTLRKLRDGAGGTVGSPLWVPSLTNGLTTGEPDRLLGDPVYRDSNVAAQGSAARSIAYGDWSAYWIRSAGNIRIERSDDLRFDSDEVSLRAVWRVDAKLVDQAAMKSLYQHAA